MTGSSEADGYAEQIEEDRQWKILRRTADEGYRSGMIAGLFLGGVTVGLLFDAAKTGNVVVSLSLIFIAPVIIAWIVWKVLSLLVKVLTLGRRSWSELVRPLDRVIFHVYTALQAIWRDDGNDPPVWNNRVAYQPTGVLLYIVIVVWWLSSGDAWDPYFT